MYTRSIIYLYLEKEAGDYVHKEYYIPVLGEGGGGLCTQQGVVNT